MTMRQVLHIIVVISACASCGLFEESDYSNCVIAQSEASYIGEKLLHDMNAISARMQTIECTAKDKTIDGGDGSDQGKVRWVVCYKGPDCDEAGMF